ncbi:succinate dehydrogenase / fumarate reductase cytochrome b subunit [Kaistia hirudinis]|uniref:Succinate dehydrogenase cytochrome b556 subunit n=1 Tax=Kaistia hirudinis TaxID=1293440 RepID=A0A840ARL3_9HYPH|nr:succinate dehydrogenase, cytochrome b556 subunit [Kaistia hirudinis]MBB3931893.1 succinate dehydrogenase / fumarate reductase cytochrome b subunit [Kaistia hirudinis]MBN9016525.1 succinate dehydrogenase, cytochrome b556 subunit [Hyphomicrobiales bacterium]
MSNSDAKAGRPLSPHLQIYRWPITMTMSILHRVTGMALYFGTLLLAWWLIAAAAGPAYFDVANAVFGSWIGRLVLFGYSWALIHHLLGGLRHFVWDFGAGFSKSARDNLAYANIIASAILTVLVWVVGLLLH